MTDDGYFMRRAIARARAGLGATYPNPCVGAVVVKDAAVVGAGRTAPTGGKHAEVRALAAAGERARGSTLYVTLEPCAHHGRTPPCTDAVLAAGVARVVVGVRDPAPHVAGKGVRKLRRAGVHVEVGVESARVRALHEHYLFHEDRRRPFVTLKAATTLDGFVATRGGDSKWITGEAARKDGHRLRARHHAIAVGVETVLADDPELTVRHVRGVDPDVVIFDTRLRVGAGRKKWRVLRPGTIVLHGSRAPAAARKRIEATGARCMRVKTIRGRIDVEAALAALGAEPIRSLLVEGGGQLLGSFVHAGLFEELWHYGAPRILGEGREAFGGHSPRTIADGAALELVRRKALGVDLLQVFRPA